MGFLITCYTKSVYVYIRDPPLSCLDYLFPFLCKINTHYHRSGFWCIVKKVILILNECHLQTDSYFMEIADKKQKLPCLIGIWIEGYIHYKYTMDNVLINFPPSAKHNYIKGCRQFFKESITHFLDSNIMFEYCIDNYNFLLKKPVGNC